jgi:hypothetical protein
MLVGLDLEALIRAGLARQVGDCLVPVIRGGDGEGEGGGAGDGDGNGDGDGDGAPGGDDDESQADNDGAPGGDGETISEEAARKLRSENRKLRERAKAAEDTLSEREKAELTAQQKAEKEAEDANAKTATLEKENRELRVQLAATKVGIRPKATAAASALVDWDEVDASDTEAVEAALKALKKEHEYLFAVSADIDAGAGGRRDRDASDAEVSPGMGRLQKAYADTAKS